MSFVSFHFLLFLCLALAVFHGLRTVRGKRIALATANFAFVATFIPDFGSALVFVGFLLGSFGLVAAVQSRRWKRILWTAVPVAILFLVWIKRYAFLGLLLPDAWIGHGLTIVGVSYMTFKTIHVLVDLHQEQLPTVRFWTFVNYQIGFFSLVAGPIQRFGDFHDFWERIDRGPGSAEDALRAWSRVLTGLLKMGIPGALALVVWETAVEGATTPESSAAALWRFAQLFYAYPAYVYFNFAGYCDIVIGAASLFGMRQVENFNRPWLARNMVDFWDRWHMSLTAWIRDYVFLTSYKVVVERCPAYAKIAGVGLLFGALFVAGIWHGSSWNFVVFGAIHGVGVATARSWGDLLKNRVGRKGVRRYQANPWIHRVAIFATFHYASASFLFFSTGFLASLDIYVTIWTKVLS